MKVIAEAGTNYADPSFDVRKFKAMHLAAVAKHAGADYVKYQLFTGDSLFCPMPGDDARRVRWEQCYLLLSEWRDIKDFCKSIGIGFIASAFDLKGVNYLKELNVDYYKVASRAADTYPYSSVPGPFIISNGFNKEIPHVKGIHLQCNSQYPTPLAAARWISTYDGLSDHSGTPWPAIDALFRGAGFVEVHFAGDLREAGPDKAVCLTPEELQIVCEARNAAAAMLPN